MAGFGHVAGYLHPPLSPFINNNTNTPQHDRQGDGFELGLGGGGFGSLGASNGGDPPVHVGRAHSWAVAELTPAREAPDTLDPLVAPQRWRIAPVTMQVAAALGSPGVKPAPIERLPREVVVLVFCFVDVKTLMMTIPSVSGRFEWGRRQVLVEVLGLRPLTRGSWGWRKCSFGRVLNAVLLRWVDVFGGHRCARRGGKSARSSSHLTLALAGRPRSGPPGSSG